MVKKIFLVVIIALISIFPFLGKGLPPTHDGEYHVVRFYEFDKTLRDGNLYPRWAPDLNNSFGVPLFNYVYPLPNYISSLLHLFGSSFIDAFKYNMLIATVLGSVFVFLWAREFWGNLGGVVSSSFFSFSPYRLLDIYIRGSVGEVWALALFPGFLWTITKYSRNKNNKYAILSSIIFALVIFAHNILSLMFFVFAIFYILIVLQRKLLRNYFLIMFLGLGLASIFWIPAILEKGYVRGLDIYDYSQNFPELYQLIFPSWGSGFSNSSLTNQLSFQIGIANLLAVVAVFILMLKRKIQKRVTAFLLATFLIVFILMLRISLPIWKTVPLMNYFQFPWRLLGLETLIASFLAGGLVVVWKPKFVAFASISIVILLGIGYTKPAYFLQRGDNYYITRSNFIDGTNSPGNTFNTLWFVNKPKQKERIVSPIKLQDVQLKSEEYRFTISSDKVTEILINTAYFPGWNYYLDNKKESIEKTKEGFMRINVGKGLHNIRFVLENTQIRSQATLLSVISALALLLWSFGFDRIRR